MGCKSLSIAEITNRNALVKIYIICPWSYRWIKDIYN